MALLVFGFLVLLIGILKMRNSELDDLLKKNDPEEWTSVMRPTQSGYVNSLGIIPLFSWILNCRYEASDNQELQVVGRVALKKARIAKYTMLSGVILMILGFAVSLIKLV